MFRSFWTYEPEAYGVAVAAAPRAAVCGVRMGARNRTPHNLSRRAGPAATTNRPEKTGLLRFVTLTRARGMTFAKE